VRYEVDDAGRVVRRGDVRLTYGPTGEIDRAERGGRVFTFVYDEGGQRLLKRADGRPVAAYLGRAHLDDAHLVVPIEVGDRVVGLVDNGAFEVLSTDPRGSVTGEAGVMNLATPYGVREQRPTRGAILDFVAKGYDPDLGVVRMGRRDYDPHLAQFWTPDPLYLEEIERCAESPVDCNLFAYADNDPLSLVDEPGTNPGSSIARKIAKKGLKWLSKKGKTISAHVFKRHATRVLYRMKSKFATPNAIKKLVERVLKSPDAYTAGARYAVFEKAFDRVVGTAGETIVRVVVRVADGKIITSFPTRTFMSAAALAVIVTGVDEANAETDRRMKQIEEREEPHGVLEHVVDFLFDPSTTSSCDTISCQEWLTGAVKEQEDKVIETLQNEEQACFGDDEEESLRAMFHVVGADDTEAEEQ
jgi:RHS repeat-associated protein